MKKLVYLLVAVLVVSVCFSEKAFAIGAIAYSDPDEMYGFCTGAADKTEAKLCAMKACKDHGGEGCVFRVWFDGCGAVAVSKKYFGIGWGKTKKAAETKALNECGAGCQVAASECEE
ncbi:MAG: DUF4189 domain-containing protein [Nitrospirota bacterium]